MTAFNAMDRAGIALAQRLIGPRVQFMDYPDGRYLFYEGEHVKV